MENKSYFSKAFGIVSRNYLFVGLFTLVFYLLCFVVIYLLFKIVGIILKENISGVTEWIISWVFKKQDSIIMFIICMICKIFFIELFLVVLTQIFLAPLKVALKGGILKLIRDGKIPFVMEYIRNYNPKCIYVMLVMYVKIILWSLLFVIPGIYKWLSYGLTPYVFVDKSNKVFSASHTKTSSMLMKGNILKLYFIRSVAGIIPLLLLLAMFLLIGEFESETYMIISCFVPVVIFAFVICPYLYAAESAIYLKAMDKKMGMPMVPAQSGVAMPMVPAQSGVAMPMVPAQSGVAMPMVPAQSGVAMPMVPAQSGVAMPMAPTQGTPNIQLPACPSELPTTSPQQQPTLSPETPNVYTQTAYVYVPTPQEDVQKNEHKSNTQTIFIIGCIAGILFGIVVGGFTYLLSKQQNPAATSTTESVSSTPEMATTTNSGYYRYTWLQERYVTEYDLQGLSKAELRIMRNFIFAYHNYIFQSEDLQNYFSSFPEYTPLYTNVIRDLNVYERANVETIKRYEKQMY